LLLALLVFAAPLASQAQKQKAKNDSVEITGRVVDAFTREVVGDVKMEILLPDTTTLIDTLTYRGKHMERMGVWGEWEVDRFTKKLPQAGHYLLRCTKKGWKTLVQPLNIPRKKYNRKVTQWPLEDILLSRSYYMDESLDEVTVTATRIKMLQKGDTVVFNADAFQLAEGSMLDGLIRQLPGVELREGGVIYVNGNKVDELLVNGKDFFKGDAKVALENLPAYTVQNVKAYQKAPKDAYLNKHHEKNKKQDPWVIDVGLKREYNTGWIGNAEAGYGTDNRYLGRAFVTRFTDHSRITAYGNANNVSDQSKPGSDDGWRQQYTPQGQVDALNGGIDISIEGKKRKGEFYSSLTGSRLQTDSRTETSSTTFLNSGDVYGRNRNQSNTTAGSLNWNANAILRKKKYYSNLDLNVGYSHSRSTGRNQTATLTADPLDSYRGASLDTIYALGGSARLDSILTNRTLTQTRGTLSSTTMNAGWRQSVTSPLNGEYATLDLSGNFHSESGRDFSHYDLRQGENEDYRNQYIRAPKRAGKFQLQASHGIWEVKGVNIDATYNYTFTADRGRRSLYRLDRLNGWGADGGQSLGLLPSTTDSMQLALDTQNSFFTQNRQHLHSTAISLTKGGDWGFFFLRLPLDRQRSTIRDTRAGQEKQLTRKFLLFNPMLFFKWKKLDGYYRFTQNAPGMNYLIDVRDDSNPLSISLGNPNLKKTYQNTGSLGFTQNSAKHQSNYFVQASFQQGTAIGNAMSYNRETGVYTYQPKNVKGNWAGNLAFRFTQPLDSAKHWTLKNTLGGGYRRSVDWTMVEGTSESGLSRVHNYTANGELSLNYQKGDFSVSANAAADYTHQASSLSSFATTSTVDFSYGLSASLKLKFSFQLDTDLTMHSRRGYEDHSMNDNCLVWNASLAKSFLKGKALTLKITGHDILQQLSNVRRSVNAQGRTETWYNTQPAYGLLTLAYKFTRQPKKKNKETQSPSATEESDQPNNP